MWFHEQEPEAIGALKLVRVEKHWLVFFQSSSIQDRWSYAHGSLIFLLARLIERQLSVPSATVASGFDRMLCILVIWVTVVFLSAKMSLASDLSHQQGGSTCWTNVHWMLFFLYHSVLTLETAVCGNPRWSAVSKYSNQLVWHKQLCHSQSHRDQIFPPFWYLRCFIDWSSWPALFLHCIADTWLLKEFIPFK